jgi:hypothetical protein
MLNWFICAMGFKIVYSIYIGNFPQNNNKIIDEK